ncbi:MAG: phosphoribosylformylglycinamidine synthase subunit PurQ [Microthrixaceae bacterium]
MSAPSVGILHTPGTNSHVETAFAFERVGASARYVMMASLLDGTDRLDRYDVVCLPGGFSYGDHLGAGAVAGARLRWTFADQLAALAGRPVIAICNGFQVAVRAGLFGDGVTLTTNLNGTFRNLRHQPHVVDPAAGSPWLAGLEGATLRFPCAHGEGRFLFESADGWRPALRYPPGENPDGSAEDIAGIVTADGLTFGLMDHPERAPDDDTVLEIFRNGVSAAR